MSHLNHVIYLLLWEVSFNYNSTSLFSPLMYLKSSSLHFGKWSSDLWMMFSSALTERAAVRRRADTRLKCLILLSWPDTDWDRVIVSLCSRELLTTRVVSSVNMNTGTLLDIYHVADISMFSIAAGLKLMNLHVWI